MQRLEINNEGKIIAHTDNGLTDGVTSSVDITGDFLINGELVKYILAKEYDLPIKAILSAKKWDEEKGYVKKILISIIGDSTVKRINDEKESFVALAGERLDEIIKLKQENAILENTINNIYRQIDKFNKERRFYERKIIIHYK